MKNQENVATYAEIIEKYGEHIHFKLDVETIYLVYEGEYPVQVFTDENVANSYRNDCIADCLKECPDYPNVEEWYKMETVRIKDFVPSENPVKKFYYYRNEEGYGWFNNEYGGSRHLVDVVSEGTVWYDGVSETYNIDDDADIDLIIKNIDNLNVWMKVYERIVREEPLETRYFHHLINGEHRRFDVDYERGELTETHYYKREVAIGEDGKPFLKSNR
jgi:hypothetical protein